MTNDGSSLYQRTTSLTSAAMDEIDGFRINGARRYARLFCVPLVLILASVLVRLMCILLLVSATGFGG